MAPTAAYDEIADWYEQEFLARQRAGGGRSEADPLGVDRALRDLLGRGRGTCLEVGCGTGVRAGTVRELGWTPVGSTCRPGCCGTPGRAWPSPGPTPSGCRSGTARWPPPSP
jgi:hypothetical protein